MITFAYPLVFIAIIVPLIYRKLAKPIEGMHGDGLEVPSAFMSIINKINSKSDLFSGSGLTKKTRSNLMLALLYIIWFLILAAVARPQIHGEIIPIRTYGREILLVIDISTSMLEQDFRLDNKRTDRITAVKKTINDFIKNRSDDKIGLIVFGSNAYLQSPITYDKKSVEEMLYSVDPGMAGNSTAIGDALGLALKTLREYGNPEKKVIILLTDGENNDGSLNLAEAISLAKKENIKIYTIGVGAEGALIQSMFGFNIKVGNHGLDEKSLKEIAEVTQGTYFKASDTKSLEKIYNTIDALEPNENEDINIQEIKELYYIPLAMAMFLSLCLVFWTRSMKK